MPAPFKHINKGSNAMRTAVRPALALLLILAAAPLVHAREGAVDTARAEKVAAVLPEIDKLYTDLAREKHLPGVVWAVLLDGKVIHSQALGYADAARKIPAAMDTRFRIASMSKNFVAMAALRLRDEGKLKLDDPVAKYLPELRSLRLPTSDSPALTIRQLMTMSTGLPEDNPWGDRQMALSNAALEKFVGAGLSFSNAPDTAYEYSNLGYVMLGKVVSKVSKMRFQDYVTKHILLPLGMKDTVWEYASVADGKLALGYQWLNDGWVAEPMLHDGDAAAMGGMLTTMDDFARYMAFHLDAWPARDGADPGPVRRATVREMHMPRVFAGMAPKATLADGMPTACAGCATAATWSCSATAAGCPVSAASSTSRPSTGWRWRPSRTCAMVPCTGPPSRRSPPWSNAPACSRSRWPPRRSCSNASSRWPSWCRTGTRRSARASSLITSSSTGRARTGSRWRGKGWRRSARWCRWGRSGPRTACAAALRWWAKKAR
jgi:CubicO group peptidase (beta-lactamase class C family)